MPTRYVVWKTSAALPDKVLAARDPDILAQTMEILLLQDRVMIEGRPTVYLCKGYVCQEPVTDPDSLAILFDRR